MRRQGEDHRIRSLRPPKPSADPWVAHGSLLEPERRADGSVERALTVFLTGSECPFTCSFCDLWRWTVEGPTPQGALPAQLKEALGRVEPPLPDRLKLYNASNFFDSRAVPPGDVPALMELAAPFAHLTVESHANTVGPLTLELARRFPGRLEVAVGLETIHPVAVQRLNKRMSLARFDRAAAFLAHHGIGLRVFVLLGPPYVEAEASVEWAVRTAEYAVSRGATRVSVIPVRGGNGELERLAALGHFVPPTLAQLEEAVERALSVSGAAVAADLWDADRLAACPGCRVRRVDRIRRLNLTGRPEPRIECGTCGAV